MARPLRVEFADAIYHVTTRGIERRAIVANEGDGRGAWLSQRQQRHRSVPARRPCAEALGPCTQQPPPRWTFDRDPLITNQDLRLLFLSFLEARFAGSSGDTQLDYERAQEGGGRPMLRR